MKRVVLSLATIIVLVSSFAMHLSANEYTPSKENLEAREWFQNARFGMFIHWGVSSLLGAGEWVMNNHKIQAKDYQRLQEYFNPTEFDAKKWVSTAKNAGMKYITFVTRHHDSYSLWDTKQSDWKITKSKFGRDVFKELADECHKQGIKIFAYYSTLDWMREDYPHTTGRTGQHSGRTGKGNYDEYFKFMKAQLTELLTNYGEISGIWLDGHWDQTNVEGSEDMTSRLDWRYEELYALVHKLQPQCLIGNNHHVMPFEGEDFQMFERDLPGENKSGLSFQGTSDKLPLETCETINHSWGFNIKDNTYKSTKELVHLLVRAAGHGANLLLNIGPLPNGAIPAEFQNRLSEMGEWMSKYGNTIYGSRAGFAKPQTWGAVTKKDNKTYLHILNIEDDFLFIKIPFTVASAKNLVSGSKVDIKSVGDNYFKIDLRKFNKNEFDNIIELIEK